MTERLPWLVYFVVLVVLTRELLRRHAGVSAFALAMAAWLASTVVIVVGPDTIASVSLGVLSIKRDVAAAKELRDEMARIAEQAVRSGAGAEAAQKATTDAMLQLRGVAKGLVELQWLSVLNRLPGPFPERAKQRIRQDINELAHFAVPDNEANCAWLAEMQTFHRDAGIPVDALACPSSAPAPGGTAPK